jgi:hypothetical protein
VSVGVEVDVRGGGCRVVEGVETRFFVIQHAEACK